MTCKRLTMWMPASPYIQSEILFPKLETLEIQRCPQLEKVPCLQLQSVKDLKLDKVGDTQSLKMEKMKVLPQKLSYFSKLENLTVRYCENMKSIPNGLMSLKKLAVQKCPSLACIPDDLSSLNTLEIRVCPLLACIPDGLSSLRELIVIDCEGLQSLPKSLKECSSLELVCICECPLIKGPIPDLGRLEGLVKLYLINSGELMIPCLQWIPNLHSLWELKIGGFGNTPNLPKLTYPHSLRNLSLQDFPNIKFLHQQFLPSTLHSLEIFRFDELEQIPEWIGNLSSLQSLTLLHCNKLKCLLPLKHATLQALYIADCPLLTERCAKDGGYEWPHISHIPNIHIS
ncbi:putative disease resistance protein RGA3 [Chenopodium quinoa]|uniref:putative disease resistance protein RGA3 n=1 Tax=Chenopodium quinoa TaxID=63459 RepID=UPI000B78BC2B|nr:putative disease resistance protein RGA3 [Chenopodium quinoa]